MRLEIMIILILSIFSPLQKGKEINLKYKYIAKYYTDLDTRQIFIRHNEIRNSKGIKPLKSDLNITKEAYKRNLVGIAKNEVNRDGSDVAFDKLIRLGADTLGENVGYGLIAMSVMKAFEESSPHYKMIINPEFDYCGISVVSDEKGRKWICIIYVNENKIK